MIGILSDTTLLEMAGISTSQGTLDLAFTGRAHPTIFYFDLVPGIDPAESATDPESAFKGYGWRAESIQQVMEDVTAGSVTFNRLIQGFMGLGLLVGVAALGVISARSVVERRQQIGVSVRSASDGGWWRRPSCSSPRSSRSRRSSWAALPG